MVNLQETFDAVVWAREFMWLYRKFGYEPDEQMMITWFANAIMVGYDNGYRRGRKERSTIYKCLDIAACS